MSPATAETAGASFGLSSIGQIAITITDLERAVAFYRDTLGIKLLFQVPGMAFFDCAGIRLMLSGAEKPGEKYSSILYFKTHDIEAAAKTLEGRGAPLTDCRTWWRACPITTSGWPSSATRTKTCSP